MKIKDIMQSKISHSQRNDKYCMIHLYKTLEVIEKSQKQTVGAARVGKNEED